jgi:hypothetical protein
MLVVEDRHRAAVLPEHVHDLSEELVARVLLLADGVDRVVPVLPDDQHGVDGQPVAAAPQRPGDRRINPEAELLGSPPAQVSVRRLIDVGRDHVEPGPVPIALPGVADKEPLGHVPGV